MAQVFHLSLSQISCRQLHQPSRRNVFASGEITPLVRFEIGARRA